MQSEKDRIAKMTCRNGQCHYNSNLNAKQRTDSIPMKTKDFYYDLPPELIAQTPLEKRDGSRLLTLDKTTAPSATTTSTTCPSSSAPATAWC